MLACAQVSSAPVVSYRFKYLELYLQEIPQHLEVHTNYTYRTYKIRTLLLSMHAHVCVVSHLQHIH